MKHYKVMYYQYSYILREFRDTRLSERLILARHRVELGYLKIHFEMCLQ
jgi:hypothetical protein